MEDTRPHLRLAQHTPPGTRHGLETGTLYLPPKLSFQRVLLVFFHGGKWLPEVAASKYGMAVISVQAGAGSGAYARAFADPNRFPKLLAEAEAKSNVRFKKLFLAGWSAGCAAIRELLRTDPMATQQLSEVHSGHFRLARYAGNSAPDHVDQLHALPEFLKWLR